MSKTESKSSEPSLKKRLVISYENMTPEVHTAFKERYPKGYADYMGDIFKVDKPDGSFFYAVSLEVLEAIYLVKITVKIDDYDDAEKGLFRESASSEDGDMFTEDNDSSFSESEPDED